jgi:hypothetical protein
MAFSISMGLGESDRGDQVIGAIEVLRERDVFFKRREELSAGVERPQQFVQGPGKVTKYIVILQPPI